ncbi:hypothetical protein LTR37_014663 [Vermiconidia calcicola]|uniref:Uncharacterized protein n=1 Tax=Vermiconidia calcicola TaxID=1690605 RepID=A0ACC3MT08_9PEZI|nr:hypothetical protein LTR37_014663 [Vermiconidia calcicola]
MTQGQHNGITDFIICLESKDEPIGKIGVWSGDEIGFLLNRSHWHKGLAKEALCGILPYLFGTGSFESLTADVDPRNEASLRILKKFGFEVERYEGKTLKVGDEWMDSVYLRLTKERWKSGALTTINRGRGSVSNSSKDSRSSLVKHLLQQRQQHVMKGLASKRHVSFAIILVNSLGLPTMSSNTHVHVISKQDIAEHCVLEQLVSSPSPLENGHIRTRTYVIALTNNNLSYAQLGSPMGWWDAFRVPPGLPAPYNDNQYGIVPAWGYGEVMESRVPNIETGMLLWGFWPTMDLPVDLELIEADVSGHWIEISESRKNLMALYRRYMLHDAAARSGSIDNRRLKEMAWEAGLQPVWEAGYLLNKAIFSKQPIHPLGSGDWNERQADLSSAVVVCLSALSKTGRSFIDGLVSHRSTEERPLGLLAVASTPNDSLIADANIPTKSVSYEIMTASETLQWEALRKARKIVIVDCGGRGDSFTRLIASLGKEYPQTEIIVVGVGGNPSIRTAEELTAWRQQNSTGGMTNVRMNATAVRDAVMTRDGAEEYFKELPQAWNDFSKSQMVSDLQLVLGAGCAGNEGLEGGWMKLCESKVAGDSILAYKL